MDKLKKALAALKGQAKEAGAPRERLADQDRSLERLSHEQRLIATCGAKLIKVQAYAGTGKTTVLEAFAHRARKATGLYLTFNKSMAKAAQGRFPPNMECRTHNGMALRSITSRDASWKNMRREKIGDIDHADVRTHFNVSPMLTKFALATLHNFIYSIDDKILTSHFPQAESVFLFHGAGQAGPEASVELAEKIWLCMCDANSELPMPHDGYLKMWALNPSQLPYDFILVDESQDSNPAFLQGMKKQKARQIFVGDEHQAIYSFRGAINALDNVLDAEEFSIRTTRRFGRDISALANAAIGMKNMPGNLHSLPDASPSLVIHDKAPLGTRPLYLARTNAGLFEKAVSLAKQGKGFHLIGGSQKFAFPDLSDLLELHAGSASEANPYGSFHSIGQLIEVAEETQRHDLAMRAKLVKKYGGQLPAHLANVNRRATEAQAGASAGELDSLSTVHQAKGLESDWVELLDDFPRPEKLGEAPPPERIEEANILYVAITRAKLGLATGQGAVSEWARALPPTPPAKEAEQDIF